MAWKINAQRFRKDDFKGIQGSLSLLEMYRSVIPRENVRIIWDGVPNLKQDKLNEEGRPQRGVAPIVEGEELHIPEGHPRKMLITKHMIAHLVFGSSEELLRVFLHQTLDDLEPWMATHGLQSWFAARKSRELVQQGLGFLIYLAEEVRVNALWGHIYPGDAQEFSAWYSAILPLMWDRARVPATIYRVGFKVLGYHLRAAWYDSLVATYRQEILGQSFEGLLLLSYNLLMNLLNREYETSQNGRQVASDLFGDGFNLAAVWDDNTDTRCLPLFSNAPVMEPMDEIQKAIREGGAAEFLQQQKQKTTEHLGDVLSDLRPTIPDLLPLSGEEVVEVIKLLPNEVTPAAASPELAPIVAAWRRYFFQVLGAIRRKISVEGDYLRADLLIHQRLAGLPELVCFQDDQRVRGFDAIILLDLSGSMSDLIPMTEMLLLALTKSLELPFVTTKNLGFTSVVENLTTLFLYPKWPIGLTSWRIGNGFTPLPQALEYLNRYDRIRRGTRHVFVITDGVPAFWHTEQESLVSRTTEAVKHGRQRGDQFWCLLVGSSGTEEMFDRMFGKGFWQRFSAEGLSQEGLQFILHKFMRHVRGTS